MELLYFTGVFLLFVSMVPLMVFIGLLVVVGSGLPVLYSQRRTGLGGKPFTIWKFRTMNKDAEDRKSALLGRNEAKGPVFKIRNDPRYTHIGKFLAHTGLDELPQLWNVLRGDMALIGPRPLPVSEAKKLVKWQQKRHMVKPGIIAPWIVEGYHRQPFDAWMKSDLTYIQHKNLWFDIQLAYRTIVLLGKLFVKECAGLTKSG